MILITHMLLAAATAKLIENPILAIILAFLSHYLLDFIPHAEYNHKKIKYIFIDFVLGLIIIFILAKNPFITYACMFFALIPDGFTLLDIISNRKNFVWHDNFHRRKLHFFKHKKISNFWRIFSQVLIGFFSIIALLL